MMQIDISVVGLAFNAAYLDIQADIALIISQRLRRRCRKLFAPAGFRLPEAALGAVVVIAEQVSFTRTSAGSVSAVLLGYSVAFLGCGIAVYLFLLYPAPVEAMAVTVGGLTFLVAAPVLPLLAPKRR
ncbi:hypothetical protein LshimejAT787_0111610 [Lyophyllum shimeji]|uniref:Uncharacterized protein n=1 Tax=Lyophyllum shimeji TaxID=47721 RepID=A0A9P3PF37_LYOSH|nr:hypothetical protein LshimejAT787_0111610 [Lyophyllum shimeji]